MVSLSVGAGLPSAAPDEARASGHGAGDPVWRYRLVAGAAELGGSVGDRGACNNAVRGIRRVCSLEFRAGGMVSLSVGAGLPSAAPAQKIAARVSRAEAKAGKLRDPSEIFDTLYMIEVAASYFFRRALEPSKGRKAEQIDQDYRDAAHASRG